MNEFWGGIITIATAIVGLAILAVLVSNNANTAGVISSAAKGFAEDLSAATNPFSGGTGYGATGLPNLSGGAGSVLNY